MSVIVKGMKMPKSCPCELVGVGYDMYCTFAYGIPSRVQEYYECCEKNTRPDWCPLIEVPPHGRLIDADAYHKEIRERYQSAKEWYNEAEDDEIIGRAEATITTFIECSLTLQKMPAIIEAEGE